MNSSPTSTRALYYLCLCCGLWAFGFGLECPLASRWLQDAGHSETFIGFNTGMHFLGVVLMGLYAPAIMRRAGRRGIFFGLMVSGLGVAAFPFGGGVTGYFALRFIAGVGGALAMIALETLINFNAPPDRRARDFAFYACSVAVGFALGSFTGLHLFAVAPEVAFLFGGALTLAALPIVSLLPPFPVLPRENDRRESLKAPFLSLGSAWSQGFLEAGMLALLPLYLRTIGRNDGESGTLIGGILIGVLICQVPIGWLADRIGRELVLIACFLIVGIGLAAAPNCDREIALPVWLFVIGIFSGAFYPLGLALLGERLPPSEIPRANAWYLSVNCFGSLVSPLVSGPVMAFHGPQAMFWTGEAAIVGVLAIWLMTRLRSIKASRAA